jgi:hypothetical protein
LFLGHRLGTSADVIPSAAIQSSMLQVFLLPLINIYRLAISVVSSVNKFKNWSDKPLRGWGVWVRIFME